MEDLRESDIVASKFWKKLHDHKSVDLNESYSHGLFLLFLIVENKTKKNLDSIVREIWKLDDPGNSNSVADEILINGTVFDWLESSATETYNLRIKRAYRATLIALNRNNEAVLKFDLKTKWPQQQYKYVAMWADSITDDRLLQTFDYGYSSLLKGKIDLSREAFSSSLAASCAIDQDGDIADLYGLSARFARELCNRHRGRARNLINKSVVSAFTIMRLNMQDITFDYILPSGTINSEKIPSAHYGFILLDPNPSLDTTSLYWESDQIRQANQISTIALAEELFLKPRTFGLALLILNQTDCRSSSESFQVRRELVEQQRLAAVIDFPSNASDGRRKFTAWLITGMTENSNIRKEQVLFIDADPLGRLTSRYDPSVVADFIGALIAGVLDNKNTQFDLVRRLEDSEPLLARIFSREFSSDNPEAPGLSRLVSIGEIRNQNYALLAKPYLTKVTKDIWSRGIRRNELDIVLANQNITGKRMYVIGNNGEGKSMLLREISQEMAAKKRRTIAIAFGATDRFPKRLSGAAGSSYFYFGARTSTKGINALQTAVTSGTLMLRIHSDQHRLRVFESILQQIGFASQQYLIPKEFRANSSTGEQLLRGVILLTSNDPDDKIMMDRLRNDLVKSRQYKLGMRRSGSRDSILPFDELSSGEQQIILLTAKVISEAASDVLFVIDEPEISLHVGWQRAVPKLLQMIAEQFDSDFLIATHSPVIIASADDKKDYCFTVRDHSMEQLPSHDRNSVETVLFEGFRTYTNHNREVHERCAQLVSDVIATANNENKDGQSIKNVLAKLDDMTTVISHQSKFAEVDDLNFDLQLIERAKAAVIEMEKFTNIKTETGGNS